jgi:hypothetical protein
LEKNRDESPLGILGIGFLTTLYNASSQGIIAEDIVKSIFNDVLPTLVKNFTILCIGPRIFASDGDGLWEEHAEEIGQHLSALLQHCLTWKLGGTVEAMITKIVEEAASADDDFFEFLYIPFAKHLMINLKSSGIEVQGSPFQKLFQPLLGTYIVEHVGAKPLVDSVQPNVRSVRCTCTHCMELNRFLSNHGENDRGFQLPGGRIKHFIQHFQYPSGRLREDLTYKVINSVRVVLVTKLRRENYATAYSKWCQRWEEAQKKLLEFPADTLAAFLGKMYQPIMSASVDDIWNLMEAAKSPKPSTVTPVKADNGGKPTTTQPPTKNIQQVQQSLRKSSPMIPAKAPLNPVTNYTPTKFTSWDNFLGGETEKRAAMCLPNRGRPVAPLQQITNQPATERARSMSAASDLIDLSSNYGD